MLCLIEKFKISDKTVQVTEFAQGGDLCMYLQAHGVKFLPEKHAQFLFSQLARGLNHIH